MALFEAFLVGLCVLSLSALIHTFLKVRTAFREVDEAPEPAD